jgi:isopentenyl diphosphate isomerase/L-lactate dehydrogenase-like FMN-dependent dehydrogenase
LSLIRADLDRTMRLLGLDSVEAIDGSFLVPPKSR